MRTALLAAVSHDLRTPLASAKAAVTSLRCADIDWSTEERAELLATADESLDRLIRLVDNLLDVSRLQAGALTRVPAPVGLDEIVALALDDLGAVRHSVRSRSPTTCPPSSSTRRCSSGSIANLVANALRYSPAGRPPLITASTLRRPRRAARDRPRSGHPRERPGPRVRPVPAARRHRQLHGRRARAGPVARARRVDGRDADPRGHPGRRADHGGVAARGARSGGPQPAQAATPSRGTGAERPTWR